MASLAVGDDDGAVVGSVVFVVVVVLVVVLIVGLLVVGVSVVDVVGCVNSMFNKLDDDDAGTDADTDDDNNNNDGDGSFVLSECALSDTCSCLKDSRC